MESAPLTLAHTHVRNAIHEFDKHNLVAASEEYDLAAAEFATATQGSADCEALRILRLLEAEHKRLGKILREHHEKPNAEEPSHPSPSGAATSNAPTSSKQDSNRPPSPETSVHPPRLPRPLRSNTRDLSSSIASNLASARGIPSSRQKKPTPISPLVSNQHADGQIGQDETRANPISRQNTATSDALLAMSKQSTSRPSWTPPVPPEQPARPTAGTEAEDQVSDAPFQQFYSTFESLISKLSAPLAFAGLPLTSPASPKPPAPVPASPKSPKPHTRAAPAAPSIDYSQLISRAALRAVSGGGSTNPSESFYVVPTTGGTISYAEIMNRAEREEARGLRGHHRQTSNLSNISEDDFLDAQSTILPSRSRDSGTIGPPSRFTRRGALDEAKVNGKTMEELSLENQALKHLSDTLSRRLHVFEMSAQTSSAALAQSIRSLHRSPLTTPLLSPENSRGKHSNKAIDVGIDDATTKRIAELEEILRKSDARARKKEEENAKLKETITKYRDKWDSLKAGAKARREREREGRTGKTGEKASDAAGTGDDASGGGA
ncbi:hypothetical protein LTR10_020999 [Elasticomyces elasticus]|uniref:MIT domain-containing protein n=1 Tax=Exophiala sideris TaxID=1016849 RepID=A0ABR0JLQ6_9EURO|nr:hypothetical protein LTR10_020999 [Elasticomyces elasticus]KAK5036508.1 hypothetical protein LTS07_002235 [Exophiala sideris]KAK5041663.1 hypothetical protein LTR13_002330 [Exophiala sideris]KAK5066891.1 hypothetical protein LTR69_002239 [Exophiala sideris]KAK5184950.1 hypothetical protein LTR44_002796 [Eurotiomycetes sp. CCFEE 6388]